MASELGAQLLGTSTDAVEAMSMQSGKRVRHEQFLLFVVVLSLIALRHVHSADLDTTQKALDMISNFADRICSRIPLDGHSTDIQLSGQTRIELNNILKQLAELGIKGSGEYKNMEYQGLLQNELAKAIANSNDCRYAVFRELNNKLIPPTLELPAEPRITNRPEMQPLTPGWECGADVVDVREWCVAGGKRCKLPSPQGYGSGCYCNNTGGRVPDFPTSCFSDHNAHQ